jgi:hypothetical protein
MILQKYCFEHLVLFFKVLSSGVECLDIFWLLIPFGLGLCFVMVTFDILQVGTVAGVQIWICLHKSVY